MPNPPRGINQGPRPLSSGGPADSGYFLKGRPLAQPVRTSSSRTRFIGPPAGRMHGPIGYGFGPPPPTRELTSRPIVSMPTPRAASPRPRRFHFRGFPFRGGMDY